MLRRKAGRGFAEAVVDDTLTLRGGGSRQRRHRSALIARPLFLFPAFLASDPRGADEGSDDERAERTDLGLMSCELGM